MLSIFNSLLSQHLSFCLLFFFFFEMLGMEPSTLVGRCFAIKLHSNPDFIFNFCVPAEGELPKDAAWGGRACPYYCLGLGSSPTGSSLGNAVWIEKFSFLWFKRVVSGIYIYIKIHAHTCTRMYVWEYLEGWWVSLTLPPTHAQNTKVTLLPFSCTIMYFAYLYVSIYLCIYLSKYMCAYVYMYIPPRIE
jgi:hypothetical protein